MYVWLAELTGIVKATGAPVIYRYSNSSAWTRADGLSWLPRLDKPLELSAQIFDGAFSDQPQQYGALEVSMDRGDLVAPVIGTSWDGGRVRIWKGSPGQNTAQMQLKFDGEPEAIEATRTGFKLTLKGPGFALSKNILTSFYDGSGDYGGTSDLANQPRPMLLGNALNIQPVYVDKARGIFQYHGYGSAFILDVFDGGSALVYDGNNYPDYASLKAASVAPGYWCQCSSLGLGRHGGSSIDVLTIDAVGAAREKLTAAGPWGARIGNIMIYLCGLANANVDGSAMSWLNANLPHFQDNYITDQSTYEAVMRDMMLKLGGYLWYRPNGLVSAGLLRRGAAPTAFLDRQNIKSLDLQATQPPYYRRRLGYQRSWRVLTYTELRTPKVINPRGTYSAGVAYNYYDLVTYGSKTWLHVGEATTTGVTPVEGPTWTLFGTSTTKTSELTDDAGLGLTALWPSVSGTGRPADYADVTAQNVAASIAHQGSLATKESVAFGSPFVTGFGAVAGQSVLAFGSGFLTGFGAVAGQNVLSYGSSFLSGFGSLSPLSSVWFGSGYITESNGGPQATLGAFKTSLGVAYSVQGQTSWATFSGLDPVNVAGQVQKLQTDGYIQSSAIYKPGVNTLDNVFPGELGANVTEYRVASGIQYQGFLATESRVTLRVGNGGLVSENGGQWLLNVDIVTIAGIASGIQYQGGLATKDNVTLNDLVVTGTASSRPGGTGAGWTLTPDGLRFYAANNVAGIELIV